MLDPRIDKELREVYDALAKQGKFLLPDKLKLFYDLFRARFGPEKLGSLDGQSLLETMHAHGSQESLVYWLEFKNDDEFPANFGSIAGGSAHKFGLFRRKETGQWVTGSALSETNLTPEQAVELARKHRDELLAGVAVLEKFSGHGTDADYLKLQGDMDRAAPTVSRLAWGHKYFSLLFPKILDDYHNHSYQRYHLLKLLQLPPPEEGLYVPAGRFIRIAEHFDWPINHFTTVLNHRNGRPIKYWRIGTRLEQTDSIWSAMRDGNFIAIGWAKLGNLTLLGPQDDLKEAIRAKIATEYPADPKTVSRKAGEVRDFAQKIEEGDIVLPAEGQHIIGIGKVTGPYRHEDTEPKDAPHRRKVEWLSLDRWDLPQNEGKLTTVFRLRKHEENLLEVEKHILGGLPSRAGEAAPPPLPPRPTTLSGIPGRIQAILDRKNQVIIYGPPGTGKTYWARAAAHDLASLATFGKLFADLAANEKATILGTPDAPGLVRLCTFHPAYGYEDFIEGYRPHQSKTDQLVFERRKGIFKRLCHDADRARDRKFFLVIDEINRGDIPRIFGELLTLLERDKRDMPLTLPVSGELFSVPPNVFTIGTMNTADRSIALLDTALRRRFGFLELMPDYTVLANGSPGGLIPLGAWLNALNERIRTHCGRDARNLQVGHAYFLEDGRPVTSFPRFARIVAEDVIPLLEEYCYEDYAALKNILGDSLVDEQNQRIREELFAPSQQEKLVQALSSISPEMTTSLQAAKETSEAADSDEPADTDEPQQ